MRPPRARHILMLYFCGLAASAICCDDERKSADAPGVVVRREGEPDLVRTKNDAAMDRARQKAQQTHKELVTALSNPERDFSGFAVKKPFPTPEGSWEHIWITRLTWDGSAFHGVVDNEPVDTTAVKFGDRVTVRPDELSDWMYQDGKRLVGGYTIRVLHYRSSPEEQKAFTEESGMEVPPVDF